MNSEKNQPLEPMPAGNAAIPASPQVSETTETACEGVTETVNKVALEANKAAVNMVAGALEGVAEATRQGEEAFDRAAKAAEELGKMGSQIGEGAAQTASEAAAGIAHESEEWLERATTEVGKTLSFVGDNPVLQQIAKTFKAQWLLQLTGQVDVSKAQLAVENLKQKYPQESAEEISHRIMIEKSLYAGGIGLVSSMVPGVALALLGVDLAATTVLQGEMIYQIAAAYNMDLEDPARKGEVVMIFGLSLGGSTALKTGFGILRNLPLAGMAIGASTNAVMLYTLGYAASRFYEAKSSPEIAEITPDELKLESEKYLEKAIAQKEIMDRILVQMILASRPDTSWKEILPELKQMNFTADALKLMESELESPLPLEELIQSLDRDFAFPLLAQCYRISQIDCVTTEEEQQVMEAIANHFDIDLNQVKETVKAQDAESSE